MGMGLMFKHTAYAVVAAAAFAAVPASAATVVYNSGTNIVLAYNAIADSYDGNFEYRVVNTIAGDPNGNFTANFTFTSPISGLGSATTTSVIVSGNLGSDLNFASAFLNSSAGSVQNLGNGSFAFVFDAPVALGGNTLSFSGVLNPNGDRIGDALATGSLTLAAVVPEPATWALFILGFGAVGHTMRRRSSKVRVAKASLNFA